MRTTPEEIKEMVDMFNSLPENTTDRYSEIGKKFNKSKTTVYGIIRRTLKPKQDSKYFNPKQFQF